MAQTALPMTRAGLGRTARRDAWWLQPLATFVGLSAFLVLGMGRVPGELRVRTVSLSLLLPAPVRCRRAQLVWTDAWLVAWRDSVFGRVADPLGARRIPRYLLLLPRRVLQGLLGRPAVVHGRRAAQNILGRAVVPAHPAERASILPVLAVVFIVILSIDVWKALWFVDAATGQKRFGVGVGTLVLLANVILLGGYTFGCHSLRHLAGGRRDELSHLRVKRGVRLRQLPEPATHALGVGEPVLRGVRRPLCPAVLDGHLVGLEVVLSHETFEHDLLVIGAGGAGLRAAIEASAAGVRVGLVCKSLLGKAHTVMAEGESPRCARQRRRAGQLEGALRRHDARRPIREQLADGRAARQGSADRVRELEAWGALFDRTKDGRILQRNFGGHKYPRLAHVGDRTGLEMIRYSRITGSIAALTSTWKSPFSRSSKMTGVWSGRSATTGSADASVFKARAVVLATGGVGRVPHHEQQLGIHRRRPRARVCMPAPT